MGLVDPSDLEGIDPRELAALADNAAQVHAAVELLALRVDALWEAGRRVDLPEDVDGESLPGQTAVTASRADLALVQRIAECASGAGTNGYAITDALGVLREPWREALARDGKAPEDLTAEIDELRDLRDAAQYGDYKAFRRYAERHHADVDAAVERMGRRATALSDLLSELDPDR